MAKTKPFDEYASQYEDWFERNKFAFESVLRAIKKQLPKNNSSLDIINHLGIIYIKKEKFRNFCKLSIKLEGDKNGTRKTNKCGG